jgi:hypothetical protein
MILHPCPGQVRKAGCPLTPCWYAVRGAGCRSCMQVTSSSSQRARSRVSSRTRRRWSCRQGCSGGSRRHGGRPAFRSASCRACPPAGRRTRSAMRGTHRCWATSLCISSGGSRTRRSAAGCPSVVLVKTAAPPGSASGRPLGRIRAATLNGTARLRRPVNPSPPCRTQPAWPPRWSVSP